MIFLHFYSGHVEFTAWTIIYEFSNSDSRLNKKRTMRCFSDDEGVHKSSQLDDQFAEQQSRSSCQSYDDVERQNICKLFWLNFRSTSWLDRWQMLICSLPFTAAFFALSEIVFAQPLQISEEIFFWCLKGNNLHFSVACWFWRPCWTRDGFAITWKLCG